MKPFIPRKSKQPEAELQDKIIRMLRLQEWIVIRTHGNKYQGGFPDLYCVHHVYGERWIEVKRPGKETFTDYQKYYFPLIRQVWVLRGTTRDEYRKLFEDPNYYVWMEGSGRNKEHEEQNHREGQIQMKVIADLENMGYTVMPTYGNGIQKGLPDLYVLRRSRKQWLELKRQPVFTRHQKENFPRILSCGVPIWILDVSGPTYDLSILDRDGNAQQYF